MIAETSDLNRPTAAPTEAPTTAAPTGRITATKKESMVKDEPSDADFASLVMNKGSREYDDYSGTIYSSAPVSCVKNKDYTLYQFDIARDGTYTLVVKYVAREMNPGKRFPVGCLSYHQSGRGI